MKTAVVTVKRQEITLTFEVIFDKIIPETQQDLCRRYWDISSVQSNKFEFTYSLKQLIVPDDPQLASPRSLSNTVTGLSHLNLGVTCADCKRPVVAQTRQDLRAYGPSLPVRVTNDGDRVCQDCFWERDKIKVTRQDREYKKRYLLKPTIERGAPGSLTINNHPLTLLMTPQFPVFIEPLPLPLSDTEEVEYYGKVLGRTLDYNDYGDSWFGLRYCYECCSLCWELMIDDNCLEITPTLLLL